MYNLLSDDCKLRHYSAEGNDSANEGSGIFATTLSGPLEPTNDI